MPRNAALDSAAAMAFSISAPKAAGLQLRSLLPMLPSLFLNEASRFVSRTSKSSTTRCSTSNQFAAQLEQAGTESRFHEWFAAI